MADEIATVTTIGARKARSQRASDIKDALKAYTWTTLEAKNLLHCISIAADHLDCVDEDIRPEIGIAIDGVARPPRYVSSEFEHLDGATLTEGAEVSSA